MPDEQKINNPATPASPLPLRAISLVVDNKSLENEVLARLAYLDGQMVDHRWLSIARTHIEQGFMAMNRAVIGPESALQQRGQLEPESNTGLRQNTRQDAGLQQGADATAADKAKRAGDAEMEQRLSERLAVADAQRTGGTAPETGGMAPQSGDPAKPLPTSEPKPMPRVIDPNKA